MTHTHEWELGSHDSITSEGVCQCGETKLFTNEQTDTWRGWKSWPSTAKVKSEREAEATQQRRDEWPIIHRKGQL